MKDNNEQILVSSIFLFYSNENHKLVATQDENYSGIPFICTPLFRTTKDRYAFRMYRTNNLYYIISNGGIELNQKQKEAILAIRHKVVGYDNASRIENESTATLTKEEIDILVTNLNSLATIHQIEDMENNHKLDDGNELQL